MIQAAIDLGTVTSRLMIGEVKGDTIKTLERSMIITDLGEGLADTGQISEAAYTRLLGALLQFREIIADVKTRLICEGREPETLSVKIVATSAMRDAHNAKEIVAALDDLGFIVEVISGTKEAELSFLGTLSGFSALANTVMTIDVGGGSTELILGTSNAAILDSHSFDIGSRRITDLFIQRDPPTDAEMRAARLWIEKQMTPFCESLHETPNEIIGVAGTATSAITIRDRIRVYDSSLVHGKHISTDELEALIDMLAAMTLEDRKTVIGLHPGRAPVILGGLITLSVILDILCAKSLLVSDTDILQGIILDETKI